MRRALEDFLIKWFCGPKKDTSVRREVAYTIGARVKERPGFSRNNIVDWVDALPIIKEYYETENLYLSTAFYDSEEKLIGYHYLYYDFDNEKNPDLAIRGGLEFARSLKERFGITPVTYLSGRKGVGVLVIVKDYIDWGTYQLLWKTLISPYRYLKELVDTKVLDKRRVHRIPYTYNIKPGHKQLSRLIDLNGKPIKPEDFDWDTYEPLDLNDVTIYRIKAEPVFKEVIVFPKRKSNGKKKPLPKTIEDLVGCDAVPPCMRNLIDAMVKSGDLDHYRRLALVYYLKWVGFGVDDVVEFFRRYAKDFDERITKYQVRFAYGLEGKGKDYIMPSCEKLRSVDNWAGICLGCGWGRNPVTYTYARAAVDPEVVDRFYSLVSGYYGSVTGGEGNGVGSGGSLSSWVKDYFSRVLDFVRETGLSEFTYDDFKRWLERREGRLLNASEWQGWERRLRQLVTEGYLGRKYLVDGVWVDYGSKEVRVPPSRTVKFYIKSGKLSSK